MDNKELFNIIADFIDRHGIPNEFSGLSAELDEIKWYTIHVSDIYEITHYVNRDPEQIAMETADHVLFYDESNIDKLAEWILIDAEGVKLLIELNEVIQAWRNEQ